tara:strand:- start:474 stop:767 length:294 start_codon:yes stop_codon:yes gene_type:complete
VCEWLWSKAAHSFDEVKSISKETRGNLQAHFVINHIKVDGIQRKNDSAIKKGIKLHDGLVVEFALIPTGNRKTACVSSQVGCSLDCRVCTTSRLKRK